MRIVVDMDEVLVDFINPLIDLYNQRHQSNLTREDITKWELPYGMVHLFHKTEGFFLNLKPIEGAIDGIRELRKQNHDVIIATAPSHSGRIASEKMSWVQLWLPDFVDHLCLTHRKDIFRAEMLIDDCLDFLRIFPGIPVVVDRPWNRETLPEAVRIFEPIWENITSYVKWYGLGSPQAYISRQKGGSK